MPDKNEKERRKQISIDLRQKSQEEFELTLPMTEELFKKLFDYLDNELSDKGCDDKSTLTQAFLTRNKISNKEIVLDWLVDKGGYCDCEILANVEDQFDNL